MSNTTINQLNIGVSPNDGTGDKIRDGGQIIKDNFNKLFEITNRVEEGELMVYRYPGNPNINPIEQKDLIIGIITVGQFNYKIEAQYNTGATSDFGTPEGFFNDGSYFTHTFRKLT